MTAIRGTGRPESHPRRKTDLRARVCNCPTTDGRLSIVGNFATLLESEFIRAARFHLAVGFGELIDHVGLRRHAQTCVSCPGQDQKTLAPDIFCRVDVGVGFVPTTQTFEDVLVDTVPGVNVSAFRTRLAYHRARLLMSISLLLLLPAGVSHTGREFAGSLYVLPDFATRVYMVAVVDHAPVL